jgi:hypothetical protein
MKKCCPKKKRRPNATAVQNLRNWYQWATQYSHKHATVGIPQGILLIGLCQPTSSRVEVALALVLAAEAYLRADGCSRPWHALHSGIECLEQLLEEMPPGDVEIISVPFDENGPN